MKTNILLMPLRGFFMSVGLLSLLTPSLPAATLTWDPFGLGGSSAGGAGPWNTSSNLWWNGATDTAWGSATNNADIAQITVLNNSVITLAGTIYAGGVNFSGSGAVTQVLSNGILALTGSNSAINVSNNQTSARIYSQVTGNGFTKGGPGTLFFNTAGAWTGSTIVSSGALDSQVNNGLSTNTALRIDAGAVRLTGVEQSFASIEGSAGTSITARGTSATLKITGSGTTTFAGNITLVTNGTIFNIAVTGAGTKLTLTGTNTYYGSTLIDAGTLIIGNGGTNGTIGGGNITNNAVFQVNRGDAYTVTNAISGTGTFQKAGAGTTTLTGGNTLSGAAQVGAGTLQLNTSSGSALGGIGSVSVTNGATLLISQSEQVNNTATVTLSGGTISRGSGVTETMGALTVNAHSYLDYGTGATGTLQFGTYTPSSLLTVNNFFEGNKLVFSSDLTSSVTNSSYFAFDNGFSYNWSGSTFTITAIPEPSAYAAAFGLAVLALWPIRRHGNNFLLRKASKKPLLWGWTESCFMWPPGSIRLEK